MNEKKKKWMMFGSVAGLILLAFAFVPSFLGFGKSGFVDQSLLNQFWQYGILGIIFFAGIFIFTITDMFVFKNSKYGNSYCFNSPGETPALIPKKVSGFIGTTPRLILFFVSFFGILGLIGLYTGAQIVYNPVVVLQQQFTQVDSLLFSGGLIPASENMGAFLLCVIFIFFWKVFCMNRNFSKEAFAAGAVIIFLVLFTIYGGIMHQMRYSSSEVAIVTTMIFWGIGGLLTVLTGSFIPFWIMHIANNLFFDLARLQSPDIVMISLWVVVIVSSILYGLTFIGSRRK